MRVQFFIFIFFVSFALFSDEKRFVIDICSYNNSQWYKKNLSSVFSQTYKNYRVIYTNDCSSDGTGQLVEAFVQEFGQNCNIEIVHNKKRQRMLANHWRTIHRCDDNEIVVHLDGDDWFFDDYVLGKLNEAYQDSEVWMTYGSYQFWPHLEKYEIGAIPQKVIENGSYRKTHFRKSAYHLRTFYAWLAKEIKLEDLLFDKKPFVGQFIPAISDWSLLYPMFEMANGRFKYIEDVLYNFNVVNPLNHDKDKNRLNLQKKCASYICRKKPYKPFNQRPLLKRNYEKEGVDVIINSVNEKNIRRLKDLVVKNITGFKSIYTKQEVENYLDNLSSYVLIVSDGFQIVKELDLSLCCAMLNKTKALVFNVSSFRKLNNFVYLESGIGARKVSRIKKSNFEKSYICFRDEINTCFKKEHIELFFLEE